MKDTFNKYGRKITEQEFLTAVSEEYNQSPSEAARRKSETNLMIDHLIGVDYPQDKREALHTARERATQRFTRNPFTLAKSLLELASSRLRKNAGLPNFDEGSLMLGERVFAEEFAKAHTLDIEEIAAFSGPEIAAHVRKLRGPRA